MYAAMEELDLGAADDILAELDVYSYGEEQEKLFVQLKSAVEDIDTEAAQEALEEWLKVLG